ncbi:MAG: S1C family serine protease [Candidatus Xenobia bacterium]
MSGRQSWGGLMVVALVSAILGSIFTYGWIRVAEPRPSMAQTPVALTDTSSIPVMNSDAIERAAEIIGPAVVNIDTQTVEAANPHGGGDDDFFRRFFGNVPNGHPEPQKGSGSGVIVSPDGFVLTNEHVIHGATDITVTLTTNKHYPGKVMGADRLSDIAIVKIDAQNLPVAQLGDSTAVKVGQWVLAVGNPYQFEHTVTVGVISGRGRSLPDGVKEYRDLLQTDAAINPGNSGGPLCDLGGRVIGINTAIIPFAQGIGFAIPVNTARNIMQQLIKTGHVVRPFIGIVMEDVKEQNFRQYKLPSPQGVVVVKVVPDSPAAKAGLKQSDVITELDGKTFGSVLDLQTMVRSHQVGDRVTVTYFRDGERHQVEMTIARMPDNLQ